MYQIDDRVSAIKEIQRLLYLKQTGIYDADTKTSVSDIQSDYSIKVTGIVDYDTFNAILEEYKKHQRTDTHYLYFPNFPYVIGDLNENVGLIHGALLPILKSYRYEASIPTGNYLGQVTLDAVNFLRKIFRMPISEEIDEKFIDRLMLERKSLELKSKFS
jgi:long-subunit fatty acid transport protein